MLHYREKWKTLCQVTAKRGAQRAFSNKVIPDIDSFTDEPVAHQCDVEILKSTFVDDSK